MLLARQNLIEQNKDTSLIEKHMKDVEAFMAESEKELAAMDEDTADSKAKRTLAERELNSNEGPLLLTNGEDDSGNEDEPKAKKKVDYNLCAPLLTLNTHFIKRAIALL